MCDKGADRHAGGVAIIFTARRYDDDPVGCARAARAMATLAAAQPGYRGIDGARGPDGVGITVGDRVDEAAAAVWRDQVEHAAIREMGRERWYDVDEVTVAQVTRGYRWTRS